MTDRTPREVARARVDAGIAQNARVARFCSAPLNDFVAAVRTYRDETERELREARELLKGALRLLNDARHSDVPHTLHFQIEKHRSLSDAYLSRKSDRREE